MPSRKPSMLKLLPIVPPSAAPMVTPGTLRMALCSEVAPCDCISALLITMTDCGTSIRSGAPMRLIDVRLTWKSSLGRAPVTVTGCMVTGAALGSAGLFSVGGVAGSLGGAGWSGGCCATAAGATRKPIKAVFTGLVRVIRTPPRHPPARFHGRRMRVIIMNSRESENYLQINSAMRPSQSPLLLRIIPHRCDGLLLQAVRLQEEEHRFEPR